MTRTQHENSPAHSPRQPQGQCWVGTTELFIYSWAKLQGSFVFFYPPHITFFTPLSLYHCSYTLDIKLPRCRVSRGEPQSNRSKIQLWTCFCQLNLGWWWKQINWLAGVIVWKSNRVCFLQDKKWRHRVEQQTVSNLLHWLCLPRSLTVISVYRYLSNTEPWHQHTLHTHIYSY